MRCFKEKKNTSEVTDAFEQILTKSEQKPQILHTDMGREFINKKFEKFMTQNNIKRYSTQSELKSAVIERFNRTLNDKLRLYFEHNGNNKWLWILPDILNDYNLIHIHRTIGLPPALVSKKNEQKIHKRIGTWKS